MANGINETAPNLRDWLLGKNLILSDTIENNGLQALAVGLGQAAGIETLPNAVQQSTNIIDDGVFYRDLNLLYNPYKSENGNQLINISSTNNGIIGNLPLGTSSLEYHNSVGSNYKDSKFNISADKAREQMLKNKYYDVDELYEVNINTVFVAPESNGIYEHKTSLMSRGIDFVANSVGLGGVSQSLGTISDNSDRQMGRIANTELLKHFGYNVAFNTSRNTLGKVNLNPLNMIGGGDILTKNFTITVPKGGMGVDYMGKVIGVKMPPKVATNRETTDEDSIFTKENPVSNTLRLNAQIQNLGKGQVDTLKLNLKENTYHPTIGEVDGKETLQGELYAFDDGKGGINDILSSNVDNDFEKKHGRITSELGGNTSDSFGISIIDDVNGRNVDGDILNQHSWSDENNNKDGIIAFGNETRYTNKKSLLHKTEMLFKSGKMKTLTTGHGVKDEIKSEVQSSVQLGYVSKGSGVLSAEAALPSVYGQPSGDADSVFCRTWTTIDRYDNVFDLQKSSGLKSNSRGRTRRNVENSVLDDNGFVRIGPELGDGDNSDSVTDTKIKRFMFSIENLAWGDSKSLAFLPECEKGPGDPTTGTRGRIMWFPPYGINFTDNSSLNWDSTNFIGRGEPIYTYNNTERSGTLQWQIIIDHPSYMNDLKGVSEATNDIFASIASGCMDINAEIKSKISPVDMDRYERNNARQAPEVEDTRSDVPSPYTVYFPNDNIDVPIDYENGDGIGMGEYIADKGYVTSESWGGNYENRKYEDTTDYGLNGCVSGDCPDGQKLKLDGVEYNGWQGTLYMEDVAQYIIDKAPSTKIEVYGYASNDGNDTAPAANDRLSVRRAENVATKWRSLLESIGDPLWNKRVVITKGEGSVGDPIAKYDTPNGKYQPGAKCVSHCIDSLSKKLSRHTLVNFVYDATLKQELIDAEKIVEKNDDMEMSSEIKKKFFTECTYFEKLGSDAKVVFAAISDKIKYFHPSYHSITPEGFNSRLTFLKQCTRQGPTLGREGTPSNLAFGRAPICILRIGDFYHTKIAIENVNFSYEPLVWDMNPEGVGVQPMICNVDMSFKFIGGSTLQGPINRLQNAVSFNYFANTEIYDDRADFFKKSSGVNPKTGEPTKVAYEMVNGVNPNNFDKPSDGYTKTDQIRSGINTNKEPEVNQEKMADKANDNNQE